ncbi:RidA family protein [Kribbella alba]|uniref:RidA family protein n=1 Tax=Kribbella alba TaxID=190197 RepID=A0ABP4QXS7_9ACTN
MNPDIAQRLTELGIDLPSPPPPRFQYVAATRLDDLVFFSGRTPIVDGIVAYPGRLGESVSLEDGRLAARIATINLLAAIEQELGLENVGRILKLTGFVASGDGFTDQPKVIDAASSLLGEVLGEAGRHARSAVGVAWLPGNAAVEVEAIVHGLSSGQLSSGQLAEATS